MTEFLTHPAVPFFIGCILTAAGFWAITRAALRQSRKMRATIVEVFRANRDLADQVIALERQNGILGAALRREQERTEQRDMARYRGQKITLDL